MNVRARIPARTLTIATALILGGGLMGGLVAVAAGPTAVGLGTARTFAVLAGSAITNTGPSVMNGDIGSFPTTTISGFPPGIVNGTDHAGDAVTQGAKTDLATAYNDAAGKTPTTTIPTELGGSTLTGGAYTSAAGTFGITGNLTLNGGGDPTSVWVFQMASTLTTATGSSVTLIGGAQSCNVFWQVGSSATLGGSTTFRGSILALTSVTLVTSATVDGRVLARNGAVTLDTNTITVPTCAPAATAAPPTATPRAVATATPTPAPTATPVAIATPARTAAPTAALTPTPAPAVTPAPPQSAPPTPVAVLAAVATPIPGVLSSLPSTSTRDLEDVPTWVFVLSLVLMTALALLLRGNARGADTNKI